MDRLYADEDFHFGVVRELRQLGYDVLTAYEAGKAGQRIPDASVLAYATSIGRAVLTFNRRNFITLHTRTRGHKGIVVCTRDSDLIALALRIHSALVAESPLDNKLIRINRPARP